jgi:hypothetical protein
MAGDAPCEVNSFSQPSSGILNVANAKCFGLRTPFPQSTNAAALYPRQLAATVFHQRDDIVVVLVAAD